MAAARIERYVLEDENGHQHETIFDSLEEAREYAQHHDAVAIVALQFAYEDSELVETWRDGVSTNEKVWGTKP